MTIRYLAATIKYLRLLNCQHMKTIVSPEIKEVINAVHYRPAISVIMPFEPKMSLKSELTHSLKIAADKVELELKQNYTKDISEVVMQRLRSIIRNLNYNTHKKSIAIFVSPVFEKVLYLDFIVDQEIIVDESFEIRDLLYCKQQLHKYLVLMLHSNECRIYVGNSLTFERIVSNTPESIDPYVNDAPQRISNFSDMAARRETMMHKFLRHIDNSLAIILKAYNLPLFVLGTERILGHFKALTRHQGAVIDFVPGNFEDLTLGQLSKKLQPYISDWQKVIQKSLFNRLEDAAGKNKLATGISNVWREAMRRKGHLLAVEKNYMYRAERTREDEIRLLIPPYNQFSYVKDAVDDIIEKVLENGGDVEFVDEDVLKDYQHIAMVQHY